MFAAPPPHDVHANAPPPTSARAPSTEAVDSERLLRGQREVLIRHGDETYRLRHTRNDKLILTK